MLKFLQMAVSQIWRIQIKNETFSFVKKLKQGKMGIANNVIDWKKTPNASFEFLNGNGLKCLETTKKRRNSRYLFDTILKILIEIQEISFQEWTFWYDTKKMLLNLIVTPISLHCWK